jgi:hypothetical protein
MTSGTTLAPAAALAAARRLREEADRAEAGLLEQVLVWLGAHTTEDDVTTATWGFTPVALAGEGAPQVTGDCVAELGAVLGLARSAAERLAADVLELGYRLPRLWSRVTGGSLRAWKARRVAERTRPLSPEAAAYVDAQVARFAHRISVAELDRLVDAATARFMPALAAEIARTASDARFVEVDHHQVSFSGTSLVRGELDLADALDLDAALSAGARRLAELGSEASLDARRSLALGALARGDEALALLPAREVVLHVHLSPGTGPQQALLEEAGTRLLSTEQVRTWCGAAGRVTVRPVVDLHDPLTSSGYHPSDRVRDHVVARDRTCVFPWCTHRARTADLDHIVPFDAGGPSDQTSTGNLAPLCRHHHRLKTHTAWTYTALEPGVYLWRSPHGYAFLRDHTGTRDLTPRPVDPPGT